jgi:hypothetical protein
MDQTKEPEVLGPSERPQISVTTYTYIEIGDRILKKVMVFEA